MNNVTIAGNISRDCEVRFTSSGDAVASFSVADNQGKDKDAIFWRCQLWGKRAQSLSEYLVKGQAVTVTGSIIEGKFTNKDGVEQKSQDVRVNDIALQGGQRQQQQAAPKPAKEPSQREQNLARQHAASRPQPDFNDDVPFSPFMARKALAV